MAADANAGQAAGTRGVADPRRPDVEQRRGLLGVEQRLLEGEDEVGLNGHG
jgi:hypothetical protein